ncbi:protein RTM1 [Kluyveromyces marxianus DMKU3-1042]|uniref:Protein RTM1 n=1 Tax=Kluyveromyces marxianus (strain DMKU3-1042 / BCC 29191 / NBRC 104275) TaxID=1003335 RepID=W0TDU7_KLUMD|nr:protein RTM1 [Kluyveromyces marxianus DMKU3-1042]BAO41535.1 protein RTM1 [Kluyveromyces marxianus DMKU3-1042]
MTVSATKLYGYYPNKAMSLVPGSTTSGWDFFNYTPTKGGAIAVAAVFGVFLFVLLYQVIYYCHQAKRISSLRLNHIAYKYIPLLVGAVFEIIGYAGRASAADDVFSIGPYIIQAIFILVAPALSVLFIFDLIILIINEPLLSINPDNQGLSHKLKLTIGLIGKLNSLSYSISNNCLYLDKPNNLPLINSNTLFLAFLLSKINLILIFLFILAATFSHCEKVAAFVLILVLVLVFEYFITLPSAATIYMVFHAMLWQLKCERISFIPPRYATTTFVCGDVLSFILQGAGGGLSSGDNTRDLGNDVILGGLAVQLVFFGFFIITEVKFLLMVSKRSPMVSRISNHWKVLNWTLLLVSLLILGRSIVRFVEFAEGTDGVIISHEWYLYVFDALFMLVCYLLFIVMFKYGNIFQVFVECGKADSEPILYGDTESYNNQKEMGFA